MFEHIFIATRRCDVTITSSRVFRYQAVAFSSLRAATEYISRVKPLTRRLIPTRVPIAHPELKGHGYPIRNPRSRVIMLSKRTHPEPGRERNWKNTIICSTPSATKMAASTNVRDCQCERRMEYQIKTASNVDYPYQHSPEKGAGTFSSKGISHIGETTEDDDPTDQNGDANPGGKGQSNSQESQHDHQNGQSDRHPRNFLEYIRGTLSFHVFFSFLM